MRRPRTAHALRGPPSSICDIIRYGYFRQVRFLVSSGADLECREPGSRRTPLMLCALLDPPEWGASIAMTLLEAGARPGRTDALGHNALHLACMWGREEMVGVLLRALDFDLGRQDKEGNTALHLAAMSGDVAITQIVAHACRKYCVNLNKTNIRGLTAGQEALQAGYTTCAHAINFALAGRRPGSATKDVRFAEKLEALATSPDNSANKENNISSRRGGNPSSLDVRHAAPGNCGSNTTVTDTPRNNHHSAHSSLVALDKHSYGCSSPVEKETFVMDHSSDSASRDAGSPTTQEEARPPAAAAAHVARHARTQERSPRPMTAPTFLTRHDSLSTFSTLTSAADEKKSSTVSYQSRPNTRIRKRKSHNPLYLYGYKKDSDVIYCAPESDFRNTPEFVCKIAHVPVPPDVTQCFPSANYSVEYIAPGIRRNVTDVGQLELPNGKAGWRQELKSIFTVYELQCSPSWRRGRKLEARPMTPDPCVPEEWEKGKRGRRQSVSSKGQILGLQRRPSVPQRVKRAMSSSSHAPLDSRPTSSAGGDHGGSPTPDRRRSTSQQDAASTGGQTTPRFGSSTD